MSTTLNTAELKAHILAGFAKRKAAIEAKNPCRGNVVLMWTDGVRFVGTTPEDKTRVCGFEQATVWGDREACVAFLRRVRGLTDGAHVSPEIVSHFNAKQHALASLEQSIKTVEGLKETLEA